MKCNSVSIIKIEIAIFDLMKKYVIDVLAIIIN